MLYEAVLLFGLLFFLSALLHTVWPAADAKPWVLRVAAFIALGAYFSYCWHKSGQTLAMKTWHLRLVRVTGQPVGVLMALLRYCAAWTLLLPGYVMVWAADIHGVRALAAYVASLAVMVLAGYFGPQKRMLHDWMTGTRVISVRKTAD